MSHDRTLNETNATWAWVTEHGAPQTASTEQLVSWLARGELPPHTLVWRAGWGEWLPAMQVAELAQAFPSVTQGNWRVARAAPEWSKAPPPVPVAQYPRLRLLAKDVVGELAAAPPMGVSQGGLAPAQAGRRSFRDLESAQRDLVTSQVPVAAMLETARAMKRLGTPGPRDGAGASGHLDFGTFGEPPPPHVLGERESGSSQPLRTLSPLAVELGFPALLDPDPSDLPWRSQRRYGRWIALGVVVGGALGILAIPSPSPELAVSTSALATTPTVADAERMAEEATPVAPSGTKKTAAVIEVKRAGELAVQRALRAAQNDGFDRVVFEFAERVPGYHLQYIDAPAVGCGAGDVKAIEGVGRLEVRFSPASAHTEGGEPTIAAREIKPALSVVREVERTCDFEGVVTWTIGTASARPFRAFELSAPPRLVVDIDH